VKAGLARCRALFFTAIGGGVVGIACSPSMLDHPTAAVVGLVTAVGAASWLKGETYSQENRAGEQAALEELDTAERVRDRLAELLQAARIDIEDVSGPDGALTAAEYQTYLTALLHEGSLSIDAYNRARAGLMPAPDTHREG
jgi:hypothetical protein